jgi:hypothetical protein
LEEGRWKLRGNIEVKKPSNSVAGSRKNETFIFYRCFFENIEKGEIVFFVRAAALPMESPALSLWLFINNRLNIFLRAAHKKIV